MAAGIEVWFYTLRKNSAKWEKVRVNSAEPGLAVDSGSQRIPPPAENLIEEGLGARLTTEENLWTHVCHNI